jgi:hypothetical protein
VPKVDLVLGDQADSAAAKKYLDNPHSRLLRVTVESQDGKVLKSGCLDAGYPLPGKIRQAQFVLPNVIDWKGLNLRAEIEVKGMRYPVRWACHQKLNDDGSLTLRPNLRQQV